MDNTLRLLIAEDSLNDAEMLISVLRNAGFAVRATRVEDDEDLTEALEHKPFDLILSATEMEALPLSAVARSLEQHRKDIPLLGLAPADDTEARLAVMQAGAADLVNKEDMDHLQVVVARELRNVNERRQLRRLEAALRESEKRCAALLDSSRDAIAYVHEGMHIYANDAYVERFGVAQFEDIEGMPILDMIAPEDQTRFKEFFRAYNKGDQDEDEIEVGIVADGRTSTVNMTFSPASIEGEPCTQILIRDKSGSQELEAQLDNLSKRDLLTNLYNRKYFLDELDTAIGEVIKGEGDASHALLYIQVDNLDAIRQNMGITAIDLVVGDVAALIKEQIPGSAVAARFSDDIFTVLLRDGGVHESIGIAEAIRKAVEDHVSESGERTITKTCTVGVAVIGESSGDAHQVVNLAYDACEVARSEGGNRVHLHAAADEGGGQAASGDWKRQIEDALEGEGFYLMFQPIVSLSGDTAERYEARIRMRDEGGGELLPGDFIPHADQASLMSRLDRWVAQHALELLAKRLDNGHDSHIFLKLSGATLADADFLPYLANLLKSTNIEGRRLVFELNEPVAVTQLNQAKSMFRGLKELRCGFALDHFGSGLNPFQLVKHLPADYLKLDRTLTENLGSSDEAQENVGQIIETAHSMKKKVITGYLEEATVLAMLWQHNADFVQGNFLQEPTTEMDYDFTGMVI
ncbi:EAL domain-containing protein [Ectothiorhodospiraceae bacterium WFHF3C12]|nr:EAL domain-containing protein [Ectothiorhodospiraceae bacterium WFHF3C12]